jgi:SAM-dependent methyltransferase
VKLETTDNHYRLAINKLSRLGEKGKFFILEVGAGAKIIQKFLPGNVEYHTLDTSKNIWKKKYTYNFDLNSGRFPVRNKIYDAVICNDTLEHVLYPEKVINEIKRVAKKNALFFFSLPNEYNFVMRIYYLFGIKTKVDETWEIVNNSLHIYKPRVKDIIGIFSRNFNIREIDYVWQSRKSLNSLTARLADLILNMLAKIWPSMFARTVAVFAVNKK